MATDPNKFYVTTPIYYVNAEPHLGHAYSTLAADILARHHRQRAEDVFFLTGTDEHGEPIEVAAAKEGISPEELVDRNAAKFEALGPIIGATNDFFIRTSDPRHEAVVAEIMQRVYDNGWVRKGSYQGWYCPRCADFKTEREVAAGNTCPIHEIPLDWVEEENWFFQLSKFQGRLEELYEERPDFVVPDFRRNEAVAFIKGGLEDVSLSRPDLKWGLPLPWDPEQRMYVWFDALLNYVTALSFPPPVPPPRRGPERALLAGRPARDGEGHPQVPRGDLAGALHGGRARAAAADDDPRLPPDGREKDVEVARQRARPVRGDRALRRRRAALLPLSRGQLRAGRLDLHRRLRVPLRDRA